MVLIALPRQETAAIEMCSGDVSWHSLGVPAAYPESQLWFLFGFSFVVLVFCLQLDALDGTAERERENEREKDEHRS